ncbi:hypothetical protein C1752_00303 [Acaryochloris thomasi RCC1774]|uniref:Uncharacterized protein n=2 Tax=Acaryochloris TaxID=155977 RepID=A0A2W1JP55_9CYAN|nr:hypothetical protein C1752_00303 [Acaryochloris thomasi RCC1774]
MESTGRPRVSIYMPTDLTEQQAPSAPIRLRRLLNEVQVQLATGKWFPFDAVALLRSLKALIEQHDFGQQRQGLAIFCSPEIFRTYSLPIRFRTLAIVTHRFHLKPLLPLLTENTKFLILAVHQNQPRLFRATQHSIEPLNLADVPQSLAKVLLRDNFEEQLQRYDRSTISHSPVDQRQGLDRADSEIFRRFQKINERVMSWRHDPQIPLLLMGTEALCSIYQRANPCTSILHTCRADNQELLSSESLHQYAWQTVAPHFQHVKQQAISQYRYLSSTEQTHTDLQGIVRAAHNGQVETLFVAAGRQIWGRFNPQTDKIELQKSRVEELDDLLNFAAVQTWLRGGQVHILEQMPFDNVPIAAILRR